MIQVLQFVAYFMAIGVIVGLPFFAGVGWGRNVERVKARRAALDEADRLIARMHPLRRISIPRTGRRIPAIWS